VARVQRGQDAHVLLALLSSRVRSWLLFAVALPLFGRLLQAAGGRLSAVSPRAGQALTTAGGYARGPVHPAQAAEGWP
jgi:hypothetical protein